jgi:tRNA G18 (ribose-2'-O)-methylase SpoU
MHKTPNSALSRLSVEEFKNAEKTPLVIVLDNIRSLHNVGSVFRTADAFLLRGICLCGITATPPHRDIEKTALGATESVYWEYFDTTIEAVKKLKSLNYRIVAIEQTDNSILLQHYQPYANEKTALIFGHEMMGVNDEVLRLCDDCVEIPQYGTKHSINIAVSTGIVVWDMFSKLKFGIKQYTPALPL